MNGWWQNEFCLQHLQVKEEGWWVVLGNPKADELCALKRVSFGSHTTFSLSIQASQQDLGSLKLYLMCDSYLGMDQEIVVPSEYTPAGAAVSLLASDTYNVFCPFSLKAEGVCLQLSVFALIPVVSQQVKGLTTHVIPGLQLKDAQMDANPFINLQYLQGGQGRGRSQLPSRVDDNTDANPSRVAKSWNNKEASSSGRRRGRQRHQE